MEHETTVKDVLKDVLETLNNISVPMSMINEIGMPLARSINGISLCLGAMEKADAEKERQEAAEAKPSGEENA